MKTHALGIVLAWCLAATAAGDNVADFDGLSLDSDSYWNGSADPAAGGFTTGPAFFNNFYTIDDFTGWAFWGGWAYSNSTDTATAGYGNQYSAIAGTGHSGANYGVAYLDTWYGVTPVVTLAAPTVLEQAWVTNTTYAYYDMLEGSGYSKKFGGDTGTDPDWFLLTITGLDAGGVTTGTAEVYLADFRSADDGQDYILDDWASVDLSGLGEVASLVFTLTSSDSGKWGMNTPAYFALDTLVTPEPGTLALVAGAAAMLASRRRRTPSRPQ
ncbi:MAG TPA: DUF4465 domain-containing protein [Phycisphaerae bacterium]|nr:DUF4465 domain-containing protein [Phycisphaerae bacterium]